MRARLLLALVAALLLAGCGIDTKDAGTPDPSTSQTGTGSTVDTDAAKRLPKRADGVVAAEGPIQGALTPQATTITKDVRVNFAPQGESNGFADLCAGKIDVLETSRQITAAERRACERNGLRLADPIQVASDAVVIATPNEHDVGGDCLRMTTVNDIFKAGSPITNWNQVGFFNIPLRATGGPAQTAAFQFFAQAALGVDGGATLDDVRSDYIARSTDDGVRFEVTSAARLKRVRRSFAGRLKDVREARDIAFDLAVDRAIRRAKARMLAKFDAETAEIVANQTVLTAAQKDAIRRRHLREIRAAQRAAQERAIARFQYPRLITLRRRYRAALDRALELGTIGIFRFSYYELFEQQLRPMEIWDPVVAARALDAMNGVRVEGADAATTTTTTTATTATGTTATGTTATATTTNPTAAEPALREEDGQIVVDASRTPWCVFPSQQTITNGAYPLSRPFLLYVSTLNLKRDEVQAFLKAYLAKAQSFARSTRLVPIGDAVLDRDLNIIDLDDTPGFIDKDDTEAPQTETTTTETTTLPGVGVGQGAQTTPTTTTETTTRTTTTTAP